MVIVLKEINIKEGSAIMSYFQVSMDNSDILELSQW